MIDLVLGTVVALSAAFVLVHLVNVIRTGGDSAEAASMTMSSFPAVTLGATTAGLVVVTDLVLIVVGTIFMFPDLIATSILGVAGYISLAGLIEIQPETWGLLVIGVGTVLGLMRSR